VVSACGQDPGAGEEEIPGAPPSTVRPPSRPRAVSTATRAAGLIPDEQEGGGGAKEHVELLRGLRLGLRGEVAGAPNVPGAGQGVGAGGGDGGESAARGINNSDAPWASPVESAASAAARRKARVVHAPGQGVLGDGVGLVRPADLDEGLHMGPFAGARPRGGRPPGRRSAPGRAHRRRAGPRRAYAGRRPRQVCGSRPRRRPGRRRRTAPGACSRRRHELCPERRRSPRPRR
jgi:hypothetical protein